MQKNILFDKIMKKIDLDQNVFESLITYKLTILLSGNKSNSRHELSSREVF